MAAMITVGLVLSAGGMSGAAHHAGARAGLAEATGWDPRRADVIVGTSAGSSTAVTLRAGLSAPDHAAYYTHRPLSPEGQTLADRVTTRLDLPDPPASEHRRPANPLLIARGLFGRGRPRPFVAVAGALPDGTDIAVFYYDDGCIGGDVDGVSRVFDAMCLHGPDLGLIRELPQEPHTEQRVELAYTCRAMQK